MNDEVVKLDYQKIESSLAKRGEIYKLSRLFFLQEAMARRGETYESVASKINRSSRSVAYYFKNDDIKLSSLYKIVWAMCYRVRHHTEDSGSVNAEYTRCANHHPVHRGSEYRVYRSR